MLRLVKTRSSSAFSMKNLGELTYILGIYFYRDRVKRLLSLSTSYIDRVLKRFSVETSKKGLLSYRHSIHLSKSMPKYE